MDAHTEAATVLNFLVVDDSEDIREVFCRMIESGGHRASTATNGVEALEALHRETFDVMLLDLSMPQMNGVGVVRWLRDNPDVARNLRIVVVSAWTDEHREVLRQLGVHTVMPKPLSLQQLRRLIADESCSGVSGRRGAPSSGQH
jgi:CheY-like chemotaxis protein